LPSSFPTRVDASGDSINNPLLKTDGHLSQQAAKFCQCCFASRAFGKPRLEHHI
jgi:hypothetical protein